MLALSSPDTSSTNPYTRLDLTWLGCCTFSLSLTLLHISNYCLCAREWQKNKEDTAWGIWGLLDSFMYQYQTVAQCLLACFRQPGFDETHCCSFVVCFCVNCSDLNILYSHNTTYIHVGFFRHSSSMARVGKVPSATGSVSQSTTLVIHSRLLFF